MIAAHAPSTEFRHTAACVGNGLPIDEAVEGAVGSGSTPETTAGAACHGRLHLTSSTGIHPSTAFRPASVIWIHTATTVRLPARIVHGSVLMSPSPTRPARRSIVEPLRLHCSCPAMQRARKGVRESGPKAGFWYGRLGRPDLVIFVVRKQR